MKRDSTPAPRPGKAVASSGKRPPTRPQKPRPDFPLSIHKGTGYWCKKVRGKVYYFGKVADDPKGRAALELWLDQKEDLLAGRVPRERRDELTVDELCDAFLQYHEKRRDTGEISPRTFRGYHDTCTGIVSFFGKGRAVSDLVPPDFHKLRSRLAKNRGAVALRNEMQRVRSVFKFAFANCLIPAPVRFGEAFNKPKLETVRRAREEHRAKHGDRMLEAAELRQVIEHAKQPLKAMILLAANTGFGASDLSSLTLRAVNLDSGWVDFPRVKTGVRRRVPLWPETTDAIREWIANRPTAKNKEDAGLLFLTVRGARWVKIGPTGAPHDAIGQEFSKVLKTLGLKRPGIGFYALRHGFETIGGETTDQVAVDAIMGHVPQGMAAHYRERIGDDRLRRVVEHVRAWLFPKENEPPANAPQSTPAPPVLRVFTG